MGWLHDQCCGIKDHAFWIFNIIFRLHQGPSTLTNGFFVTKACPFYIDSATSKRLSPQLLVLVYHTVPFTKMILPNWTWNIGRLLRMVVGPPADTNWASPWHEILQGWNNKVQVLSDHAGLKPWSVTCVEAVWKFASYVATLPSERWTRRILHWNISGRRTRGRPAYTWETALERYCIWKGFDNWIVEAFEYGHWMRFKEDFVFSRCTLSSWSGKILHFICLRPKGAAFGPASFDLTWLARERPMVGSLPSPSPPAARSGPGADGSFPAAFPGRLRPCKPNW